ncbi:hypothetical protein P170DRAFT_455045 [Aspergillus steynii IBT 23096]|uniref:Uncharacterized protein n=1 Tax=Aspergillus steynii IBT 23096 TaxID=1392250 RepID=A0A2I2GCF5_9EURO|nr:uncharacterized protein P170DRAFT_455045 [Aspergillus steynii IBT 23096]PLB50550.1 hypothetical protein P170DRAFT_455045 [Aspergillus steynii IBT 23096]
MNPPLPPPPQGRSLDRVPYHAPTKASFAKSPIEGSDQSLSKRAPPSTSRRSPSRHNSNDRQIQSRSKMLGLRDRKALRPSLPSTASPMESPNHDNPSPVSRSSRRSIGLQAFAAPPRRVSRRIGPSDLAFPSPAGVKKDEPDAGVMNTPEDQLALELGSATGGNDRSRNWNPPALDEEFEEPDLPPTPTQLGLEKLAGRSRGLLSSSPTTQRLGRRQTADLLGQSPSKLRNVDDGAEAVESASAVPRVRFPEPVSKKRRLREELTAEAKQLKEHIADLECWSVDLSQHDGLPELDVSKIMTSLLASEFPTITDAAMCPPDIPLSSLISTLLPFSSTVSLPTPAPTSPPNPFALSAAAHGKPHLTVFAPLSLKTNSDVVTVPKSAFVERHSLTFSVPPPFPPELYSVSLIYETNFETQAVVSVAAPETVNGTVPQYLQRWVNSRLENPLLKLDVSGLCWGINRYWEAVLSRAYVWLRLEDRHTALLRGKSGMNEGTTTEEPSDSQDIPLRGMMGNLTVANLRRILPHLQRTSMLFGSEERTIKVILSCEISVDEWACEPQLTPGLTISGASIANDSVWGKTEQEAKNLFNAVIHENTVGPAESAGDVDANAIIEAANHVLGALFGVGASLPSKDELR